MISSFSSQARMRLRCVTWDENSDGFCNSGGRMPPVQPARGHFLAASSHETAVVDGGIKIRALGGGAKIALYFVFVFDNLALSHLSRGEVGGTNLCT
jgi:hypothetical protein